jgi:hypothetical protein
MYVAANVLLEQQQKQQQWLGEDIYIWVACQMPTP